MKYFLDTEFIEGLHKPMFGKKRHFIDLISIGIVSEDGAEYQAISKEYDYATASDWVKKNVILPLYRAQSPTIKQFTNPHTFHKAVGKSNAKIANEIIAFINPHMNTDSGGYFETLILDDGYGVAHGIKSFSPDDNCPYFIWRNQPEFFGYYADYDWVLLCSLFGTMMQLPKGFPMYCRDLKQMVDGKVLSFMRNVDSAKGTKDQISFDKQLEIFKKLPGYPKQANEHGAIDDARWNRDLYKFLTA